MNPVRAKLVESPDAYAWSSFAGNVGLKEDRLIAPHPLYAALGRSQAERCVSYRALFDEVLTDEQIGKIRHAVNRNEAVR
jgi:putative transposase